MWLRARKAAQLTLMSSLWKMSASSGLSIRILGLSLPPRWALSEPWPMAALSLLVFPMTLFSSRLAQVYCEWDHVRLNWQLNRDLTAFERSNVFLVASVGELVAGSDLVIACSIMKTRIRMHWKFSLVVKIYFFFLWEKVLSCCWKAKVTALTVNSQCDRQKSNKACSQTCSTMSTDLYNWVNN